jgi:hypothetical protein
MTRTTVFAIALIAVLIALAGCTEDGGTPAGSIPEGSYVFVDHHVSTVGTLVSGSYPQLMIDFPTYSFDENTGVLSALFLDFEINDSLVVVLGDGASLGGDAGGGAATMLHGGYSLPYSYEALTVEAVTPGGSLELTYRNESLVLEPGVPWKKVTNWTKADDDYVIDMTSTDRITFFGIFDKADITKY